MMLLLLSCLASCCLGSASLRASPALDDLLAPSPPGDAAEPRRLASLNDRLYVKHLDGLYQTGFLQHGWPRLGVDGGECECCGCGPMACSQCTDKMIRKCCTGAGYFAGPTDADAQGIVDRAAVDSIKAEIIKGRLAALEHPGLDPDEAYWDVAAAHWDADEGLQLEIHERLPGVLAPEYVLATFIDFLSAGPADAGVEYNPTRMPSDPTDPDGGANGDDNDADGLMAVDPDGGVPTRYGDEYNPTRPPHDGSGMPHLGFLTMNAAGELSVESPGGSSNGVGGQCDCCGCGPIDCDKCTQKVMDKCCPSMGFTGDAEVEGP